MRKAFISLLVLIFFSDSLRAQIIQLVTHGAILAGRAIGAKKEMPVFKSVKFDSGYSVIGIAPDAGSALLFKDYCFIVNSLDNLKLLKKNWIASGLSKSVPDQPLFKIYALKNHEIKQEWNVFPSDSAIYTSDDYFKFDISLLRKLASKFPLEYDVKIDSFNNREEFAIFKEASIQKDSFLFVIDPIAGFEGNFPVKVEKSDKIESFQDAVNELDKYCSRVTGKSKYSINTKNNVTSFNSDNQVVFIIKSDKQFYDKYNSDRFIKGKWTNELVFSTSYWKK